MLKYIFKWLFPSKRKYHRNTPKEYGYEHYPQVDKDNITKNWEDDLYY